MKLGGLALAGALVLAACAGSDDDSMARESSVAPAAQVGGASLTESDALGDGGDTPAGVATEGSTAGGGFDIGIVGRDVIIEMHVTLSSDDIQRTVASIMATASSLGGGVASSNVDYGNRSEPSGTDGYAVLVVKVPPESLDRLLAGLDDSGTVQSINQTAQDVTDQLVDLDTRIRNARQSVDNVREFMDRTENLQELVTLEGELTRRQTDLERLEAQQRNLSDRVALSTVTIEVTPTARIAESIDEDESIADAFRKGWDAFSGAVFGVGFLLAVLLPFLALAAVVALVGWQVVRRGRRPATNRITSSPATEPKMADPAAADVSSGDTEPANPTA